MGLGQMWTDVNVLVESMLPELEKLTWENYSGKI